MNIFRMRTITLIYFLVPVAIVVLIGAKFFYASKPAETPMIPTEPTVIADSITAIGTVVPKNSAELSFSRSGTVTSIPYDAGARVVMGTLLASLDTRDALAKIASAKSDLVSAEAEIMRSAVLMTNAEEDMDGALNNAYANLEDAVKKRLDPLFSDDDRNPQLTFRTTDSQIENDLHGMRSTANKTLAAWKADFGLKEPLSAKDDLIAIRALLYRAQDAVQESLGLSDVTITSYKTEITAGLVAVNRSIADLNAVSQAIRTAKADEALTRARIERAKTGVEAAQVAIAESNIYAPFAGTITARNFKPGEFAGAGQAALSLASSNAFEIETDIPEAYISKIIPGKAVSIVLDAYPDTTITGAILSLDPAGRPINDVVYYRMKVSIYNSGKAVLKGGLTANVTITP